MSSCSTGCSGARSTGWRSGASGSTEAKEADVMAAGPALVEVRNVRQAIPRPSGAERVVIDKVNLALREREIVGLLGRSGSGKSTLLRIVAGLAHASAGEVVYLGKPIEGPAEGIAMVFQTFALFPWLTVLENVEI